MGEEEPCCSGQSSPSLGDRLFAWAMAKFGPKAEWRFLDRKLKLFEGLSADRGVKTVVEVGLGAAPNLKLYAARVDRIIGVDPNTAMQPYARQAAEACGAGGKLQLVTGRAEALPLPDASADAVVMTHVLCTVSDPQRALAEVRRVLRPGGRLLFLEHVAAEPGSWLLSLQRALNPAVHCLGHGCSATRRTLEAIEAAGFASVDAERFRLQVLPSPLLVIVPHVCGTAVR